MYLVLNWTPNTEHRILLKTKLQTCLVKIDETRPKSGKSEQKKISFSKFYNSYELSSIQHLPLYWLLLPNFTMYLNRSIIGPTGMTQNKNTDIWKKDIFLRMKTWPKFNKIQIPTTYTIQKFTRLWLKTWPLGKWIVF